MAGLVPAIPVFRFRTKIVDARDKPGHDDGEVCIYSARLAALVNFFNTRSRFSFDR
jgi:hypothetical protein